METTLNNGFYEMSQYEIMVTDGGKGWGWVGLVQPAYDFLSGVWDGFKKPCKKCK